MEQRIREILSQRGTKTSKIRQLILLGVSRTEIARLLTNGNYGQVQNVYTKMINEGIINRITRAIAQPTQIPTNAVMTPRAFDKQFGVELECYNISNDILRRKLTAAGIDCNQGSRSTSNRGYWKITTDSSIRGANTFELVSPILQGEAGLSELMKVCKVLNQCKAKVNMSCGTHVHINARNFTIDQWKRLYINYSRLESVIDGWMANSRRGNANTYCKSFTAISNFESRINQATTLNEIAAIMGHNRYWKVNPQSYSVHNTCEFRQHAGTTSYVKVAAWIRFLSNLVDYSENHTVNERTLDSLKAFNSTEMVDYLRYRTLELTA
jgi:hypothetical protein